MRKGLCRLLACAGMLAAGLCSTAHALSYAPPEPLVLRFEPGSAQLDAAGTAQVDRLAVRAARCGDDEPLHLTIAQDARVAPPLQQSRQAAVTGRLAALGVVLSASTRQRRAGASARAEQVTLSVRGGDGVFCVFDDSRMMRGWAAQLATHLTTPSSAEPAFWSRMSRQVRDEELALRLARIALCAGILRCSPQRDVFWWLAARSPRGQGAGTRESWLELVWVAGSDAELSRAKTLLRLRDLSLARRARQASLLARGPLTWPVVERRLLAPGLLTQTALSDDPDPLHAATGVLIAAVDRGEVAAIGRLLDAASPAARACYVSQAVMLASDEEFHTRIVQYVAGWARKPIMPRSEDHGCHPTDALLRVGVCWPATDDMPAWARGAQVWRALIDAGFTLDEGRIDRAGERSTCCYERTGDPAMPVRAVLARD